jgi:hypothetical protein
MASENKEDAPGMVDSPGLDYISSSNALFSS